MSLIMMEGLVGFFFNRNIVYLIKAKMSTYTVIRIRKFKKDRQHNCQTKEKGQYRGRTRVHCNVIGRKCWEHLTVFGLTRSELGSKKYTSK
jgi:hypothetical protein